MWALLTGLVRFPRSQLTTKSFVNCQYVHMRGRAGWLGCWDPSFSNWDLGNWAGNFSHMNTLAWWLEWSFSSTHALYIVRLSTECRFRQHTQHGSKWANFSSPSNSKRLVYLSSSLKWHTEALILTWTNKFNARNCTFSHLGNWAEICVKLWLRQRRKQAKAAALGKLSDHTA